MNSPSAINVTSASGIIARPSEVCSRIGGGGYCMIKKISLR